MTTEAVIKTITSSVSDAIAKSEKSVLQISKETGIPQTTLLRSLKGRREIRITEVFLLSESLGLDPQCLLSESFAVVKEAS